MGKRYSKSVKRSSPSLNIVTQLLAAERPGNVEFAAGLLRSGNLVAMPTETVYGLAANALNAKAVNRIFRAKKRPYWDPLIVHVATENMLGSVAREVSPVAKKLIAAFWPGPLTLLLPRCGRLPKIVTAARDLVGVRMPNHPVAVALMRAARTPVAAPSANLFGHISPTTAAHVMADLKGRINAVLDAGPCSVGVESTVLDPAEMIIYRQGGVSAAEIERVTGLTVTLHRGRGEAALDEPSPGMADRHYAPEARLLLAHTEDELRQLLANMDASDTGVMLPEGWSVPEWQGKVFQWAPWGDAPALARTLYGGLRALEANGVGTIVSPLPANDGEPLAVAVRERLLKAAQPA